MTDYPFYEVAAKATKLLRSNRSAKVYQKFTCSGCGNRLTIDKPNTFYESGTCDNCPTITNIKEQGCNLLVTYGASKNGESSTQT